MIDLKENSGLEIFLKENYKLGFHNPGLQVKKDVRFSTDMEDVLKDPQTAKPKKPLYYMYRDIGYPADKLRSDKIGLRYDITVMLPKMLGSEFNKTKGHYHPKASDDLSYPEVYEVIYGRAYYLIQKPASSPSNINKCFLVRVREGEKLIIPPNFGHVTINVGPEPLVMSNWVARDFDSEYENFKSLQGACYYILSGSPYRVVKNKKYENQAKLKKARPLPQADFNLEFGKPMYQTVQKELDKLDFLKNPSQYQIDSNNVLTNI